MFAATASVCLSAQTSTIDGACLIVLEQLAPYDRCPDRSWKEEVDLAMLQRVASGRVLYQSTRSTKMSIWRWW